MKVKDIKVKNFKSRKKFEVEWARKKIRSYRKVIIILIVDFLEVE